MSSPASNISSNMQKGVAIFFLIIFSLLVVAFSVYQIYRIFDRTQVEKLFAGNQDFAILLVATDNRGSKSDESKEAIFISVLSIHPATSRVGVISFFPDTYLKENSQSLRQRFSAEDIAVMKKDIALTMGIDIPFYIEIPLSTVSRFVDLTEGIPYYLWQEEEKKFSQADTKVPAHNLPQGEFILDGSLVNSLLQIPLQNEFSLAERLYRQYSFMLNFWKVREEKWKLLSHTKLFYNALAGSHSNMSAAELFFLAQVLLSEKNWLPLFMEVPVLKKQDKLFMDAETGALFLKDFQKKLTVSDEILQEESPRIQVRNGTHIPGLARKIRNLLAKKGLVVLEFSNADRNNYKKTLLIDRSTNVSFVQNYARLTGARYYFSINRSLFTDIVVIIGDDYRELKF